LLGRFGLLQGLRQQRLERFGIIRKGRNSGFHGHE